MQLQKISRNLTAPIIAPTHCVSLTSEGWRCLHRDSWDEKHHEFFGQSTVFYQNTIASLSPFYSRQGKNSSARASIEFWTIEAGGYSRPVGRVTLQVIGNTFHQGLLFLDLDDNAVQVPTSLLGQLITYSFLTGELATLKIISLSGQANKAIQSFDPRLSGNVTTFSRSHLPDAKAQTIYHLEPESWFESTLGRKSLESLLWIKKRIERARAMTQSSNKRKKKRPFLFSLLTLGKSQRR